jgi:hypothetical protein
MKSKKQNAGKEGTPTTANKEEAAIVYQYQYIGPRNITRLLIGRNELPVTILTNAQIEDLPQAYQKWFKKVSL